ncbi:MAG: topoisomerase C-terminal repeat-containing protein [Butyrivibrio sp.]|uniref:type IA DNA topoisomerase n=1 Tax=Butyrivibrio sp. TaxID=28121 RepID=UPI001B4A9961|nr:type IA DNA topoisomerase [Butyrivibrio sp.]MBP3784562.1 topoisomerase C-terminal repeat-containing protein [Butyrivibrio sp.]
MKKALLIAEKPSLRRTIEEVYNKHKKDIPYEIHFMEQRGHLLTLKSPNEIDPSLEKWDWEQLPIYPDELGGWKYKVIQEKKVGSFLTAKERFDAIRKELSSGSYDFVINAGDPDQEGQLLVRIVLSGAKNTLPIKRYWSNDTTEAKVLDALLNLKDDESDPMLVNLLEAAYVRQHSDWLFGMNVSRAATLQMNARAACGRVKTPIMAIVCKREDEINNFVPKTCYGVKADYDKGFTGALYEETSESEDGDKDENAGIIWFDTEEEARDLIASLPSVGTVKTYESKKVETYAPKLYKLATAQVDAGKMGFSSSRTLEIIQSLYEKKLMSYPRTDCEYLSSGEDLSAMLKSASAVPGLDAFVSSIDPSVIGKVKHTKKWVNDEKLKESGHSALVPTTMKPDFSSLSDDEQKIYTMIAKRFVAIFLPPLVQNKRLLIADMGGNLFKSTGKTLIDAGYTEIFKTKFTDNEIPEYAVGESITVEEYEVSSKTSTCPRRFTDADLIAVCEAPSKFLDDKSLKDELGKKLKIGTPATRANIIEELITKDKYLMRTKEKSTTFVVPTEAGKVIYENLKDCDICKVDLTGEWELKLEAVRGGKMSRKDVEIGMKEHVRRLIEDIHKTPMKSLRAGRSVIGKCPECGGDIISSEKSFYCSNYKDGCHFGAFRNICDSKITDEEFLKMLGGDVITKKLKKGSTTWDQQLKYNLSEHKVEFVKREAEESEYSCPNCGGKLTDNGRVVSCSSCEFKLWLTVGGKVLTKAQVDKFFKTGSTGLLKGLKSKSGKKFDAEVVLNSDGTGTQFKFSDK